MSAGRRHPPPRRRAGHPEDGRARRASCRGRTSPSWSARSRSWASRPSPGFWSKDGIVSAALSPAGGRARLDALDRRALVGALLTGALHDSGSTSPSSAASRRELAAEERARTRDTARGRARCSIPVGVLTVLATVGGLVVIPGRLGAVPRRGSTRRAEPLVEPTTGQDYVTSADRRHARPRRHLPRAARVPRRPPARDQPRRLARARAQALLRRALRRALLPPAAVALATRSGGDVEEPVVERSLDEIGAGTIQVGGEVARVQTGLLRTYALAIAFAVAVLVVVFVAVR